MTRCQLFPFQKPDRPTPSIVRTGPISPTATQFVTDRQVTALNRVAVPVAGVGVEVNRALAHRFLTRDATVRSEK